jgi:DNA repair protein RecO (recombination protein O)
METKVRAFSLGSYAFGEGDRLVVFYTREQGKLKASAKGVRKPASKLVVLTELFNESALTLARRPGAEIYRLVHGTLADSHPSLRERLASISALQVMADVMRSCVPDAEPQMELYDLLASTLSRVGAGRDHPEAALTAFLLRFLEMGGYPLALEFCAACGKSDGAGGRLSALRGGWVCASCDPSASEGLKVSREVLALLRRLRREGTGTLPGSAAASARDALRVVGDYLRHTVEHDLPTLEYYLRVTEIDAGG